ncbi:MAG TPA: TolC family protein [Humisphaera sp.]
MPREKLRTVEPIDLESVGRKPTAADTQPAAAATTAPTTAPVEVALTIADVRRLALANNLDLKVELFNSPIAREAVTEAEAAFEAVFTTNLNYTRSDAATASQLESNQSESWVLVPGIDIPLRTGGTLRLSTPLSRSETDNAFTFLNPAYASTPAATLSVPLLRGAGVDYNAQRIRVAFYAWQRTEARTKLEVTRVLADAERAYWRLLAARQVLAFRRDDYDLAMRQLATAARRLNQNLVPEVDLLRAQSGVADRRENILVAERDVRDRQRELKRIINVPALDVAGTEEVIPASAPNALVYDLNPAKLYAAALDRRMELLETELLIAEDTANVRAARNELLPLVTLEYTYGVNGLGASLDDALSQVRRADFQDHRAGLRVEVPIGNEAARSRLRRSLLARVQRLATKDQRRLQVRQEVYAAVDTLQLTFQRIVAAGERVRLARRVFDGEYRQYLQGRRTSNDVFDALTRLADAQQSEIAAVAEYQISQVDLAFATGMVLGRSKVAWEPVAGRPSASDRH